MKNQIVAIGERLQKILGSQSNWWDTKSEFETIVGAILTQNTTWNRVQCVMQRFQGEIVPQEILAMSLEDLEGIIRPCGYFHQKAVYLRGLAHWCVEHGYRNQDVMYIKTAPLRKMLLGLHGVGPETADSILLYAWKRPVFVVDAYTRRVLSRLSGDISYLRMPYDEVADLFYRAIEPKAENYAQYHAWVVQFCKEYCLKKTPKCKQCPFCEGCRSVDI